MVVMASARRWAVMPGPGRFFGQEVTMRHSIFDCAKAGVASAVAGAAAIRPRALRLLSLLIISIPKLVKVMNRTGARTDLE